jgi:large subunit ribosomal protein L54
MICRNCLRAASRARTSIAQPQRFLTTSSRLANATPPPSTTATTSAQPLSDPLTPAAPGSLKAAASEAAKKKATPLVKSSIAAGTPLKGLNFEKNKQDPVALPDDEYPEWLWTILQRQEKTAEGAGMGDLFCMYPHHLFHITLPLPQPYLATFVCRNNVLTEMCSEE